MKKLPKYFAIKADRSNPLWNDYIKWLNETYRYKDFFNGESYNSYYGYHEDIFCYTYIPKNTKLITLKQWNKAVKIVGYKLKEDYKKYREASEKIMGFSNIRDSEEYFDKYLAILSNDSVFIRKLKKAGVLDLWFEPVYEEDFKVGDWVVVLPEDEYYDNAEKDCAQKINRIIDYGSLPYELNFSDGSHNTYKKVRKATPEEIEKAKKGEIVTIEGYPSVYKRGYVEFGCKTIPNDFIKFLYHFQSKYNINFNDYKKEIAILVENLKE